ncbi:MAG TPA: hypothetical protein VN893_06745 [Bryobacteraceae bacterium]|nr:hypothetical protein [Bryobacteraceae bacterium]
MRRVLLIGLSGALGLLVAQKPAPRFEDYPATEAYKGKNAPVVLASPGDRKFRTMLREAAAEKPNFAGHFVLAEWGCGAGCVMGAAIDANTGKVSWLPHTICCWPVEVQEPIEFRLASRLIVFIGERNEKEGDDGTH